MYDYNNELEYYEKLADEEPFFEMEEPSEEQKEAIKASNTAGRAVTNTETEDNTAEVFDMLEWSLNKDGSRKSIRPKLKNYRIILENDNYLKKHAPKINQFSNELEKSARFEWDENILPSAVRRTTTEEEENPLLWNDRDTSNILEYIEDVYGLSSRERLETAIDNVATSNRYHPVINYLNACLEMVNSENCKESDLDYENIFIKTLGVEDTPYSREITRMFFMSAIKRVLEPGCKCDNVPILVGDTGLGKTLLIEKLGKKWAYVGEIEPGKESVYTLNTSWMVELGEGDILYSSRAEKLKTWITQRVDKARLAYAKHISVHYRHCVFVMTCNNVGQDLLSDPTTNRRWSILDCKRRRVQRPIQTVKNSDIDYVWGMAYKYYIEHFNELEMLIYSEETEKQRDTIARAYTFEDGWTTEIKDWLLKEQPEKVCCKQIYIEALEGSAAEMTNKDKKRIQKIMNNMKNDSGNCWEPATKKTWVNSKYKTQATVWIATSAMVQEWKEDLLEAREHHADLTQYNTDILLTPEENAELPF